MLSAFEVIYCGPVTQAVPTPDPATREERIAEILNANGGEKALVDEIVNGHHEAEPLAS